MADKESKEGVSIKEIENFTKKNRFEVFLCLVFLLASVFSFIIWGTGWSVAGAFLGAVGGVLLSAKVDHFTKKVMGFLFKQESTTQLVLAIVLLVLAIVIPPLYFLVLGLHGGKSLYHMIIESHGQGS